MRNADARTSSGSTGGIGGSPTTTSGAPASRRHPGDPEVAVVAGRGPGEGAGVGLHALRHPAGAAVADVHGRGRAARRVVRPRRTGRARGAGRAGVPGSHRLALYIDRHAVGSGLHADLDRALGPVGHRPGVLAGNRRDLPVGGAGPRPREAQDDEGEQVQRGGRSARVHHRVPSRWLPVAIHLSPSFSMNTVSRSSSPPPSALGGCLLTGST